jgi:hypothetical protein
MKISGDFLVQTPVAHTVLPAGLHVPNEIKESKFKRSDLSLSLIIGSDKKETKLKTSELSLSL